MILCASRSLTVCVSWSPITLNFDMRLHDLDRPEWLYNRLRPTTWLVYRIVWCSHNQKLWNSIKTDQIDAHKCQNLHSSLFSCSVLISRSNSAKYKQCLSSHLRYFSFWSRQKPNKNSWRKWKRKRKIRNPQNRYLLIDMTFSSLKYGCRKISLLQIISTPRKKKHQQVQRQFPRRPGQWE